MYVPGSARDLVLSDATTATEEILAANPPESVEYRLTNLTNSFRYLVRQGNASLSFHEVTSDEVQVEWKYSFDARNWSANLVLWLLIATFWTGFMRSALSRVKRLAEEDLAPPG